MRFRLWIHKSLGLRLWLSFGGTGISWDFARGTDDDGGVSTGGIYSFDTTGDGSRMLGVQPTEDDFTLGFVELRILNDTGPIAGNSWGAAGPERWRKSVAARANLTDVPIV